MNQPLGLDYRILIGVFALTAVAITPFTVLHLWRQEWLMGVSIGALDVLAAGACVWMYLRRRDDRLVRRIGQCVLLLANLVVVLNVYAKGGPTIFWLYPMIFANFYLLSLFRGMLLSVALSVLCLAFAAPTLPADYLARVAAAIPLCVFFGIIFSHSITNQQKQLKYLASHDALTGLGNRHGMEAGLTDAVARKARYGERCSMLVFDIDNFKLINDSLGHYYADRILTELAQLMRERIRVMDRLYRFGGEEFVLLVPHAGRQASWQLAEALRMEVEDNEFLEGTRITVSAGVAELGEDEDAEAWFNRADRALLNAKEAGRNCVAAAPGEATGVGDGGGEDAEADRDFRVGGSIPGPDIPLARAYGSKRSAS